MQKTRACAVAGVVLLLLLVATPACADSADLAAAQSVGDQSSAKSAATDDAAEATEDEPRSEELLAERDDLKAQLATKTSEYLQQHRRADALARQVHSLKQALQAEQKTEHAEAAKVVQVHAVLAQLSSEASAAQALIDEDSNSPAKAVKLESGHSIRRAEATKGTRSTGSPSKDATQNMGHHSVVSKSRLGGAAPATASHAPHRTSSGASAVKRSQEDGGKHVAALSGGSHAEAAAPAHPVAATPQPQSSFLAPAAKGASFIGSRSRDTTQKVGTRLAAVSSQSPQTVDHHDHSKIPKRRLQGTVPATAARGPHRTSGAAASKRSQEGGGKDSASSGSALAEVAAPKHPAAAQPQPQLSLLAIDDSAESDDLAVPAEVKLPEGAATISVESKEGVWLAADPLNVGAALFGDGEGTVNGAEAATGTDLADLQAQFQQEDTLTDP